MPEKKDKDKAKEKAKEKEKDRGKKNTKRKKARGRKTTGTTAGGAVSKPIVKTNEVAKPAVKTNEAAKPIVKTSTVAKPVVKTNAVAKPAVRGRTPSAGEIRTITAKQQKSIKLLIFLIVIGIAAGVFLRIAIGRKLLEDIRKGEVLYSEGMVEDALQVFEKISGNYPRFQKRAVSYLRAVCLNELGRVPEANALWERVLKGRPDNEYYPASWYQLAHLDETNGQYDEAAEVYEKLLSDFGDSDIVPEVLVRLGHCYEKSKKWEDARQKYGEVLLSYQNTSVEKKARKALGDLNIRLIFSQYMTEEAEAYEVRSGDTLEKIANEFNTTVSLIKKANKLAGHMLPFGKRLKITPGNFAIHVNADSNILTLKLNGKFFKEYPVGTGKFGCTPIGTFKIINKQAKPVWYAEDGIYPYGHTKNILGTRWMGLDKLGYGIHGTTLPETVGKHASRGCIRLYNKDIDELFMLATVGTSVVITGTTVADAGE